MERTRSGLLLYLLSCCACVHVPPLCCFPLALLDLWSMLGQGGALPPKNDTAECKMQGAGTINPLIGQHPYCLVSIAIRLARVDPCETLTKTKACRRCTVVVDPMYFRRSRRYCCVPPFGRKAKHRCFSRVCQTPRRPGLLLLVAPPNAAAKTGCRLPVCTSMCRASCVKDRRQGKAKKTLPFVAPRLGWRKHASIASLCSVVPCTSR